MDTTVGNTGKDNSEKGCKTKVEKKECDDALVVILVRNYCII